MLGIEKDLHGTKHYKSFYWKQFRKKTEKSKIHEKTGRIRKKTVKNLNDQECAVCLMKRMEMRLSKFKKLN